jgi:hypothetical protein
MSRGPGHVQRAIGAALLAEPARRFTTDELIVIAYGDLMDRFSQAAAVSRAVSGVPGARRYGRGKERTFGLDT